MKSVWEGLPHSFGIMKQGRAMKQSRWFSFVAKAESFVPYWSSVLVVLLYFGLFKGWISNKDDLPFLSKLPAPTGQFGFEKVHGIDRHPHRPLEQKMDML